MAADMRNALARQAGIQRGRRFEDFEPSAFGYLPALARQCRGCKRTADYSNGLCELCDDAEQQAKADQWADEAREARYGSDE